MHFNRPEAHCQMAENQFEALKHDPAPRPCLREQPTAPQCTVPQDVINTGLASTSLSSSSLYNDEYSGEEAIVIVYRRWLLDSGLTNSRGGMRLSVCVMSCPSTSTRLAERDGKGRERHAHTLRTCTRACGAGTAFERETNGPCWESQRLQLD